MLYNDKAGDAFRTAYVKQLHDLSQSSGINCLMKAYNHVSKKGLLDANEKDGFEYAIQNYLQMSDSINEEDDLL